MKTILVCALAGLPLLAQTTASDKAAEERNRSAGGDASRSTLEVAPGPPIIKNKDLIYEKAISPWKRMPRYVLHDQVRIWTSPFHTSKADAKWWAIFGGAAAVLLATDRTVSKDLPNTNDQISVGTWTSRIGAAYSLLPISGAFYFIGLGAHNDRFRETGILSFEALANTEIVSIVLKAVTRRERPLEGNGNGDFWSSSGSALNASFPSGHAINSWALASVIAHEYPRPLIVPITAYGLASLICGSRLAARKHFPSDVVVGAAMGWFIGDYVFAKHHNREIDNPKASAIERIMSHVHMGGPQQAVMLPSPEAHRAAVLAGSPALLTSR